MVEYILARPIRRPVRHPARTNSLEFARRFDAVDARITRWMARAGIPILRIALGVVFVWFGALKLFPGMSPAEDLVRATVPFVPGDVFVPFLGIWEVVIGIGFITGRFLRLAILLLFLQMPGTLAPAVLLPERVFDVFPFVLTIEGQYIFKNFVLIAAALVIGATVRGGRLVEEPPEDEPAVASG
jgi:uncharacterized membrane protein YphA (DoxX/SURF4 family)